MNSESAVSQSASRRPFLRIAAVAALALLAGCAQMRPTDFVPPTTTTTVLVVASSQSPPVGYTCYRADVDFLVCVSQDPIMVPGNLDDPNILLWTLATSGWKFADQGIDIKPRGQWDPVTNSATAYSFQAKKNGKHYKYTINLKQDVQSGTPKTLQWDPSIMN